MSNNREFLASLLVQLFINLIENTIFEFRHAKVVTIYESEKRNFYALFGGPHNFMTKQDRAIEMHNLL